MKQLASVFKSTKVALLTASVMCGTLFTSCHKKAETGYMNVRMTDAPAAYTHVYVEVTGMEVNSETGGWVNVPITAGVYDLLALQNNVSVLLATRTQFPAGRVNQLRLQLGANNSLVTATGTFSLKVPSGAETGLKVNLDTSIRSGKTIEIVLDFDANASVVDEGNGTFSLKPVIRVKSVTEL
jgi:hypothetical protein